MDGHVNRAKQLWENWEHKASQIQNLTGANDDKSTLEYKYKFLTDGLNRLSVNPSEKEKLYVHTIKIVTDKLRKQLYPNPVLRFLHRLKNLIVEKPAQAFLFKERTKDCLGELQSQFKSVGLQYFTGKLERELDFERQKIDLKSLSNLANNNQLQVKVQLEKVAEGTYRFNGYTATLINENGEKKSALFSQHHNINLNEAVNILQGQPVYKSQENADGTIAKSWFELERREKELDGRYEVLSFSPSHSFDLKKVLLDNAIQLEFYGISKEAVLKGLEAGNKVAFEIPEKGQYFITANPSERTVNFYDAEKKPISLSALKEVINPVKLEKSKPLKLIKQKGVQPENQIQVAH
ncbi:hypothetical protein [Pedobacter gandavensis]|uniref:Uncharacterized protein n=1 Tax=Pedobacter gandavensis TaxID=2679963 RepID=A0ABR6EUK8_9SPHI|nr:hypothetical protein [Pedobacter gandavensis]MBB2148943.1 hypothetical protein [Pedobacter gandavensis]